MKTLAIFAAVALLMVSCRDQEGETPNENYEMNRGQTVDTASTAHDTIVSNSTQTDPAVTD